MMNKHIFTNVKENGLDMDYLIYKTPNKENILLGAKENQDKKTKGVKYEIGVFNLKTRRFKKGRDYFKRIISKSVVDTILSRFRWELKYGDFMKWFKI